MLLPLLLVLMNVNVASSDTPGDQRFGRFDTGLFSCRITHAERSMGCQRLQLMQTSSIGLRVRFIGVSEKDPGRTHQLTYVTGPGTGDPVLSCQNGHCRLAAASWSGTIISSSLVVFDQRGLPIDFPSNRPTTGECRINERRLNCESQTRDGLQRSAEARL